MQVARAYLHTRSAKHEGRRDPACVTHGTCCDDGHFDRVANLRNQGEGTGLGEEIVAQEMPSMAARFEALRNHRINALLFEPNGLLHSRRRANDTASGPLDTMEKRSLGKPEMEADDLRPQFLDNLAERAVEWAAIAVGYRGGRIDAKFLVVRLEAFAPGIFARIVGAGRRVAKEIEVDGFARFRTEPVELLAKRLRREHRARDRCEPASFRDLNGDFVIHSPGHRREKDRML